MRKLHPPSTIPRRTLHPPSTRNHSSVGERSLCRRRQSTISVALPATAFVRVTDVHCLRVPKAAAQLVAALPVMNQGPHRNGVANTGEIAVGRVLLMPPADAPRLLTKAPLGTMTKAAFFQRCIQAGLAHADADLVNAWTRIGLWFCAACTLATVLGADVNCLSVAPATPACALQLGASVG